MKDQPVSNACDAVQVLKHGNFVEKAMDRCGAWVHVRDVDGSCVGCAEISLSRNWTGCSRVPLRQTEPSQQILPQKLTTEGT